MVLRRVTDPRNFVTEAGWKALPHTGSQQVNEALDGDTRLPQNRAKGSAIQLLVIGNDDLRERFIAAKNDVTRLLATYVKTGTRQRVNALATRNPRQLRHTATTRVSK